ncbi:unnamed protein product [Symbiodinium microadriaticum]|nr:unnamed protein product [Symbiodinium microadriaticum]CAE7942969.1 unnamed protein product [Symbiodinium sp. KB8]
MKLYLLLPFAFAHGPPKATEVLHPLGPGWIRKESLQKLPVSISPRGEAAIHLLNGTAIAAITASVDDWTRVRHVLSGNDTQRHQRATLAQLGTTLSRSGMADISGTTLFIWLGAVLALGLIVGVGIPFGVSYYYEEVAAAPFWLNLPDLRRTRNQETDTPPQRPQRSESPEARRGSSRRRPSRRREREVKPPMNVSSSTDDTGPDFSAEDRTVLYGPGKVDKASLCFAQLPKTPQEHVATSKQMSSDESDHSAKGLRMQAELLADKTGQRHRLSTESTTAEESTSSISSILRVKDEVPRDSLRQSQSKPDAVRNSRGRSPDEPQDKESRKPSAGKRAVSFDAKVEVQSMEVKTRERSKRRTTSQKQSSSPASKKDPRARRRGHLRSRSPQSDA